LTGDSGYAGVPLTEHHNTLLINGKGQGKEGSGHDAFAEVPYELLNRIRIADVKVEPGQVVVRGDATAAYLPQLGLKKFVREFVYKPGSGFTVSDEVENNTPAVLTWLLHADDKIEKGRDNRFSILAGAVRLLIDPFFEGSKDLRVQSNPTMSRLRARRARWIKVSVRSAARSLCCRLPSQVSKTRFVQRLKIEN
jgi:hypothetical protein